MSSTLSIDELTSGYAEIASLFRRESGFSSCAGFVSLLAGTLTASFEDSQALFGAKTDALSELWTLAEECSVEDWDGYGAGAIHPLALKTAEEIIRALPDSFPLPEFAPEPDGSISLDWIQSKNRLFSISAGTTNRLAYAWLDGSDKGHGVSRFDGESVPLRVLQGIQSIAGQCHAPFRAA